MQTALTRRRFLTIVASAAAGLAVRPGLAQPSVSRHTMRDVVLGADAEIQLYHADPVAAGEAMADCFAEAKRLEAILSLHQPTSALANLNRAGHLQTPPPELVRLLDAAIRFSEATEGAFDVTVQPLWALYSRSFKSRSADEQGPNEADLAQVLERVGYSHLRVSSERIEYGRPGMSVTLNGIAQGFITDRISERLRARGFDNVLVNMGELRAIGGHADSQPWRVGLADPDLPWRSLRTLALQDRALATSGGYSAPFDASGRHHHLFDPRTGRSADFYRSVSVVAADATTADALSTGLFVLPPEKALAAVDVLSGVGAYFLRADGSWLTAGLAA